MAEKGMVCHHCGKELNPSKQGIAEIFVNGERVSVHLYDCKRIYGKKGLVYPDYNGVLVHTEEVIGK